MLAVSFAIGCYMRTGKSMELLDPQAVLPVFRPESCASRYNQSAMIPTGQMP